MALGQVLLAFFLLAFPMATANENVTEDGYVLYAPFDMKGMVGKITFQQMTPEDNVTITINLDILQSTEEEVPVESFEWAIQSFPVAYDTKDLCHRNDIGSSLHKLHSDHGKLTLPNNETTLEFTDMKLKLVGKQTIWGRSILLTNSKRQKYCATIMAQHEVKTAKAKLFSPVAGEVILRENQYGDTTILTNLYSVSPSYRSTLYPWRIMVSDVLDRNAVKGGGQGYCEYLNTVFDPDSTDSSNCSEADHKACQVGQLTGKHGGVKIGSSNSRYSRKLFVDTHLPIIDLGDLQSTFIVLYEVSSSPRIMSCGQLVIIKGRDQVARFSSEGVHGYVRFTQESPYHPTIVSVNLGNLKGRAEAYHIHEFPKPYRITKNQALCSNEAVGGHYNPFNVDKTKSPLSGFGTTDQYELGDLSGKFGNLVNDSIDEHFIDFNLPMFGAYSIVGRTVVIHAPSGDRWICANIEFSTEMTTAIATFYYPIVGYVIFRQEKDNPFAETSVFAELSYSDGTRNNTLNHRWAVHAGRPGKDFYGWRNRCLSADEEFNPHNIVKGNSYSRYCHSTNVLQCSLGDLTSKLGRIAIAARKGSMLNKIMKTDLNLALTGAHNAIGHSVVLFDEKAPTLRGNRLACTTIFQEHPIKVQVKKWQKGIRVHAKVNGAITLYQQTRTDPTKVTVEVSGLNQEASGYHIHKWSVPDNLEFPCTDDAVSGHFNPFNVSARGSPEPGKGTFDQYEVGDFSGKYGTMRQYSSYSFESLDSTLSLRGPNSIMGRSVVIHSIDRNFRWVCGNFEPDVKVGYANKVIALASFDQLEGHLRGYIRLTQLVYPYGGASDTTVEVMLRYPGKNNRNVTTGHKWSVYVNQVGADAEVKAEKTRCIAAGYLWNPYLVDTENFDLYTKDCSIYNPLRCQMGDLGGRHGLLTVGVDRKVFTDVNLPLYGNASVLGRSIVIQPKNGSPHRLGCANLILERHLVQKVTIRRSGSFGSKEYMDAVRDALNTFEWLLYAEAHSQTLVDNGDCVELTIHFRGSNAYRLSVEFKNLMNTGQIRRHTRLGVKQKKILYRLCTQDRNSAERLNIQMSTAVIFSLLIIKWYHNFT